MTRIYQELRELTVDETGRVLKWVVSRLNSERPQGEPEISVFVNERETAPTCTECQQSPGDDYPHFIAREG
jgi:hypothetical protein